MRNDTVIVFARAPRLGAVKRRLGREIGARAALRFHQAILRRLLRTAAAERRFRTVLALTPDSARPPRGCRIPVFAQRSGDLGARMARAFARFKRRRVLLVGSDIPDLCQDDLVGGFRALGRARAVFGPSADGGYWLVGMGPLRPATPFRSVRWSSPQALADTERNFAPWPIARLRELRDVDRASDLPRRIP